MAMAMAISESRTSVVGINFGHFGVLGVDSLLTSGYNGKVSNDNFDKTLRLYPGVWAGFSGVANWIRILQANLPPILRLLLPFPTNMLQVANFVSAYIGFLFGHSFFTVEVILLGSVNLSRCEMFKISKHPFHGCYYPRMSQNYACTGTGSWILEEYRILAGFDINMSYYQALDYASYVVQSATCFDWRSGGPVRVVGMRPGQRDILFLWRQHDTRNCQNPYTRYGPIYV